MTLRDNLLSLQFSTHTAFKMPPHVPKYDTSTKLQRIWFVATLSHRRTAPAVINCGVQDRDNSNALYNTSVPFTYVNFKEKLYTVRSCISNPEVDFDKVHWYSDHKSITMSSLLGSAHIFHANCGRGTNRVHINTHKGTFCTAAHFW